MRQMILRVFLALLCVVVGLGALDVPAPERARALEATHAARKAFATLHSESPRTQWEFSAHVRDIDNYDMGVGQNRRYYVIVFLLKDKRFIGGGGEYWIRKSDLRIEKFRGYE